MHDQRAALDTYSGCALSLFPLLLGHISSISNTSSTSVQRHINHFVRQLLLRPINQNHHYPAPAMCWTASFFECLTPHCKQTSPFNSRLVSRAQTGCRNKYCNEYQPCNTNVTPRRSLSEDQHPQYKRYCNDCRSSFNELILLRKPLREYACRGCGDQFDMMQPCKDHVASCPKAYGSLYYRMTVTFRDINNQGLQMLPRMKSPPNEPSQEEDLPDLRGTKLLEVKEPRFLDLEQLMTGSATGPNRPSEVSGPSDLARDRRILPLPLTSSISSQAAANRYEFGSEVSRT